MPRPNSVQLPKHGASRKNSARLAGAAHLIAFPQADGQAQAYVTRGHRIALACALLALGTALIPVLATISVATWQTSALVRMSPTEPLAPLAKATDPAFWFVHADAHYDGVYFYAIARDPLARGAEHNLIDNAAYRYGHAGYGLRGWLASAGLPAAVPLALLALGLFGIALAAGGASLVAQQLGWSPWSGLVVAVNPGLVYAPTVLTSEAVGAAVLTMALLAWLRQRWVSAGLLLVALCLIKEQLVLVPVGIAVWEAVQWARGSRPRDPGRRALALAGGPLVFGLWQWYLWGQFGVWPVLAGEGLVGVPLRGWFETFRDAARMGMNSFDLMQLGQAEVPILATLGAALAFGVARALRVRTVLDPIFLLLALLFFCLNRFNLLYPKDLIRASAIVLLLLPGVLRSSGVGDRRLTEP